MNNVSYPLFYKIQEAKERCHTRKDSVSMVSIDEKSARIGLQELLNLTTKRLALASSIHLSCTFISKWECDGVSDQSMHKQRFANSNTSDVSVFITSIVPLQLTDNQTNEKIKLKKRKPQLKPDQINTYLSVHGGLAIICSEMNLSKMAPSIVWEFAFNCQ